MREVLIHYVLYVGEHLSAIRSAPVVSTSNMTTEGPVTLQTFLSNALAAFVKKKFWAERCKESFKKVAKIFPAADLIASRYSPLIILLPFMYRPVNVLTVPYNVLLPFFHRSWLPLHPPVHVQSFLGER